jgi:MOSC domain-containing protein YiiM
MNPFVEAIFVTARGGEPMRRVSEVRAIEGGLEGDRYRSHQGYWSPLGDECQVTLIEAEALDDIEERGLAHVKEGQHRRNIVIRGADLRSLAGHRFTIGEAILAYDRPRPPCRYIASITEPTMTRALAARRGGICASVVRSGVMRVGDQLVVEAGPVRPLNWLRRFG